MSDLPAPGTRVSLRYRLPAGSVPPLTDVVGHLLEIGATLRVQTKRGDVVDVAAADVIAIKALSDRPVRTGDIRNLEHAAALAWPGVEREWLGGWLLRFGHGKTRRANSAVPLGLSIDRNLDAVIDWYTVRGAKPLIAAPDRLFRISAGTPVDGENLVMTRELDSEMPASPAEVTLASRPDERWLALYGRDVPTDVLAAVVDGETVFATIAGAAVGRGAVTVAPDGTRWVGLSAVHVVEEARGRGLGRMVCAGLLAWGGAHDASRAYVQVLADNAGATRLYESLGFSGQHRSRYVSLG
jgi:GNAT superfamily N-acetyltransferase